jgi:lipoprotein-releasing system permease protein
LTPGPFVRRRPMSPNLRIACRFLTAKKRAMLLSLSCTILGVGLFIVTQATTSGFQEFYIRAILGTDGAVRLEDKLQDTLRSLTADGPGLYGEAEGRKLVEGVDDPVRVTAALKQFDNVTGISAVLRSTSAVVRGATSELPAHVFGIDIDQHAKVSSLTQQIVAGSLEDFRQLASGVLIGRELANRLQASVGDSIALDVRKESQRFRIAAIYQTGVSDIDKIRVYVKLGEARSLLKKPFGVSFLQVNLRDPYRAIEDARRMEAVVGYGAKPWQIREEVWLEVFGALKVSSGITVTVFSLIASLAMFSTLAMIVLEKTKDIAILRSMGYTRSDITQIFLWQASMVLVIGAILGSAFGAVATWGVSQIPLNLRGIIVTKHYVVDPSVWHYVAAVSTAAVMVMIASVIPARRAARLEPGDIVRGTAQ